MDHISLLDDNMMIGYDNKDVFVIIDGEEQIIKITKKLNNK